MASYIIAEWCHPEVASFRKTGSSKVWGTSALCPPPVSVTLEAICYCPAGDNSISPICSSPIITHLGSHKATLRQCGHWTR